jgi:DMSO reductase family type II enzyme heme b subunit
MGPGSNEKRADVIKAFRLDELPKDDGDEAWSAAPIARLKTAANVIEPPRLYWPSVEYIRAQAFYTETEVALRIQWDDRSQSKGSNTTKVYPDGDGKIYTNTDHPDQFAIQFPAKQKDPSKRPYFLYGDGKRPVNLWWWRSDRGAIAERNAKGFSNMRDQPERSQTVMGRVSYADGRYTMVVRRTLTTDDRKRDVQFEAGSFAPISFHAFDGSRGEVGLRGAMTTWYWLHLKPQISERTKQVPYFAFALSLVFLLLIGRTVKRSVGNNDDAA